MTIELSETIRIIGSVGGFAGFISLFIHLANFFRDKAKITVQLQWDAEVSRQNNGFLPPPQAYITVKNIGRRPVYIDTVTLNYPGETRHLNLLTDGLNPIGRKLEEGGEPILIKVPQTQVLWKYADRWKEIQAITTDISGREYKSKAVTDKPSWASLAR